MWVIPSRQRPHRLQTLIDAAVATGMSTPAWVRVDADDPTLAAYKALERPKEWILCVGPRLPLSGVYNEAYAAMDAEWWGIINDDVVPETAGWDRALIALAARDGMAVPAGGHGGTPHFVLGADLPRSTGWLSLPGLDRIYIDTVWADIAGALGVLRHAPDVVLRHRHFSNGGALFDATYRKRRKIEDRAIYEAWKIH